MTDDDHVIIQITKGRAHATCIHVWERGVRGIMSLNGPKECMVNDAIALMDRIAHSTAVALMSLPGPRILYLIRVDGEWQDVTGQKAQIQII